MLKNAVVLSSIAVILGLGLGECAWAISLQPSDFAWPLLERVAFWVAGAALGLAWAWANAGVWRLAFGFDFKNGLRFGAVGLVPALLGLAWPLVVRFKLPYPHDEPVRVLQILFAAQCLGSLGLSTFFGLAALRGSAILESWPAKRLAIRLSGAAMLVFCLSGHWIGQWNMTGDSPHYVLMAHSLAYDHDEDLSNNYKSGVWRRFFDREDLPTQIPDQPDGRHIPEHKPGLSILVLPGYVLAGASGVRWTLALVSAGASGLIFLLCLNLGYTRRLALLGWALFAFAAPWWTNAQMVMPEMLGGMLLLLILCVWQGMLPRGWVSFCAFVLVWVSVRFYPLAGFVALVEVIQRRRLKLAWWWSPLAWSALSLGLGLYLNYLQFGHISPGKTYEQRHQSMAFLVNPGMMLHYAWGLMIDQEYGWLPYTPVFALSFLGLWAFWLRDRAFFWFSLLPALVYIAPVTLFHEWWSSMAPNRYVVCLTPMFAIWALEVWRSWGSKLVFQALAAASITWALCLAIVPWFCWSKQNGENWPLRIVGMAVHRDLAQWFPSFMVERPISQVWIVGILILGFVSLKVLGRPKGL